MITSILGVLFDGLAYGMLLFLISVGLSVTLGLMNFINLAHGAFAMLGGYVCVLALQRWGLPFVAVLPLAFVISALAGLLLERVLYRYPSSNVRPLLARGRACRAACRSSPGAYCARNGRGTRVHRAG